MALSCKKEVYGNYDSVVSLSFHCIIQLKRGCYAIKMFPYRVLARI